MRAISRRDADCVASFSEASLICGLLTAPGCELRVSPRTSVTTLGRAETRASEASRARREARRSGLSSSSSLALLALVPRPERATHERPGRTLLRSLSPRALAASMTAEGHLGKAPLLRDGAKHAGLGSSEIPRISWRRAIGVFHLYLAWLIAELIALCVQSHARRCAPSAHERATRARAVSSPGERVSVFFNPHLTGGSDLSRPTPPPIASLDTHAHSTRACARKVPSG